MTITMSSVVADSSSGAFLRATTSPAETPWMWTLAYGDHEDRTPTHGGLADIRPRGRLIARGPSVPSPQPWGVQFEGNAVIVALQEFVRRERGALIAPAIPAAIASPLIV